MDTIAEYRDFLKAVRSSLDYWKSYALLQFTTSLTRVMRLEKVSGRKLAGRLKVSPAQVSKVLRGNENVTIETMAKFADALGAAVHVHVAKKGVVVRWEEVAADTAHEPERLALAAAIPSNVTDLEEYRRGRSGTRGLEIASASEVKTIPLAPTVY